MSTIVVDNFDLCSLFTYTPTYCIHSWDIFTVAVRLLNAWFCADGVASAAALLHSKSSCTYALAL